MVTHTAVGVRRFASPRHAPRRRRYDRGQTTDPPWWLPAARDLGLIGDGRSCALVGRDGAINWMCVPRFDNQPLFCALLDRHRGGQFLLSPADLRASRQYYLPDTGVLVTEMHCPTGIVEVTDAMLLRAGADLADNARAPLTANCCAMRVYYKGMPRCGL